MYKKKLLAILLFCLTGYANASILTYDITISGGWFDNDGTPFGMPLSPTLTGTISVDNTQTDIDALVDFSLTTGTKLWTEEMFVGGYADTIDFTAGSLTNFSLSTFDDSDGWMYIYSNNTFAVQETTSSSDSNACNGCVSFEPSSVPEPTTLALMGLGLAGIGWKRRKAV